MGFWSCGWVWVWGGGRVAASASVLILVVLVVLAVVLVLDGRLCGCWWVFEDGLKGGSVDRPFKL